MPRNEPSNFERLHGHMRQVKQELGIDMLHPHGVSIHGKMYPANNKHIAFSKLNSPDGGNAGFNIPLENGHRLYAWVSGLDHPEGVLRASFAVHYPHVWTDENPTTNDKIFNEKSKAYSYYPKILDNSNMFEKKDDEFQTDNLNPKSSEEFLDFMKQVSTAPRQGFKRSWSLSTNAKDFYNHPDSMMDDDDFIEFQKHRNLGGGVGSKDADPSHIVRTTIFSTPMINHEEHIYDVKTEQLRKNEEY